MLLVEKEQQPQARLSWKSHLLEKILWDAFRTHINHGFLSILNKYICIESIK